MSHARKMAEIKREFLLRTREDMTVLRRARGDAALWASKELKTLVHRLAGVTGMFGYEDVSALAAALDDVLPAADGETALGKLDALIAALEAMFNGKA
jgi:HPt (histidine-containing phosphotransfer) domain-containing protein